MSIPLVIDIQNRILVQNTVLPSQVYQNDTLTLLCSFVKPINGTYPAQYQSVDLSATNISAQIGAIGGTPNQGYFEIIDPGANQKTNPIPFNAPASTIQSLVASTLSNNWANVTVTGSTGSPWILTNGSNGACANFTGQDLSLVPGTDIIVTPIQPGTTTTPCIQQIDLLTQPLATSPNFTGNSSSMTGNITVSGLTVTEALASSINIQRTLQLISVDTSNHQTTLLQAPIRISSTVPLS